MHPGKPRSDGPIPFINVTPLIDVLLVLLIIFMVISPKKPHQFRSQIPEKPRVDQSECETCLVVTIPGAGRGYRLNSTEVATIKELGRLLFNVLDGRPNDRKAVFIKASRSLNYGEVVRAIDIVKGAGGFPVGLQIENLEN